MTTLRFLNNVIADAIKEIATHYRLNLLSGYDYSKKPFIAYYVDDVRFNYMPAESPIPIKQFKGASSFVLMFCKDVTDDDNVDEIGTYIDLINNAIIKIKSTNFTYIDEITGSNVFKLSIQNAETTSFLFTTADESVKDIRILVNGNLNYNIIYL